MPDNSQLDKTKKIKLAIHQPNFYPRLKVLQKLAYADVWCILDSVQYCTREWQNRTCIIPMHGNRGPFWLSIPVNRPNGRSTLIKDVSIINPISTTSLIERTLHHAFHRAPYWSFIKHIIRENKDVMAANNLTDMCVETTNTLLNLIDRRPTLIFASTLDVRGKASNLMAAICKHLNATTYLADSGSKNYLVASDFTDIEVVWQNWEEPIESWPEIKSWRNLSSVNYLCREGPEKFANHLIRDNFTPDLVWSKPKLNTYSKSR